VGNLLYNFGFWERADELEFFESKESLTTMEWTLTLGNIIAHPLSDEKLEKILYGFIQKLQLLIRISAM
jgi:hypothetical protein